MTEEAKGPVLVAEGLRKRFGRREVVSGVSLSVACGEVVGLLGRNGAGKTTTFRMVMGMEIPDSGRVMLAGQDISRLSVYLRARRGMGYLSQEPSIFQRLSVFDNLMAVLEFIEPDARKRPARVEELLGRFGIWRLKDSLAGTLSGGERRRLEIARSLLVHPKVILLDEPFSGVDPIAVADIKKIIAGLQAEGIGILITDHNVRETLAATNRAYIIQDGHILKEGSPDEIVADPKVRTAYLGEDFRL